MLVVDGTSGVTFNDSSLQGAAASPYVLKNRIINGDMSIDQRNSGASVTVTTGYVVDRWGVRESGAGSASFQQVSDAPTGFNYSFKTTVTGTVSPLTASDRLHIYQPIEGYNVADLGFGTANAKTITISFWVKSSVTGQFGGSIVNSAANRSYVFNFTVSSASTWEQKTVTLTGDTTGTWLTTNGIGLSLYISMAAGSTYTGTANVWQSGEYFNTSTSVNLLATSSATFQITGVQLEIGTSATPFERRLYNQELANCQRYFFRVSQTGTGPYGFGYNWGSVGAQWGVYFPTTMRSNPTFTSSAANTFLNQWSGGNTTPSGISLQESTNSLASVNFDASGLTAGQGMKCIGNGSFASFIAFSAEL